MVLLSTQVFNPPLECALPNRRTSPQLDRLSFSIPPYIETAELACYL